MYHFMLNSYFSVCVFYLFPNKLLSFLDIKSLFSFQVFDEAVDSWKCLCLTGISLPYLPIWPALAGYSMSRKRSMTAANNNDLISRFQSLSPLVVSYEIIVGSRFLFFLKSPFTQQNHGGGNNEDDEQPTVQAYHSQTEEDCGAALTGEICCQSQSHGDKTIEAHHRQITSWHISYGDKANINCVHNIYIYI